MKELTAMLDACAEYRAKLDELERENAALRAELEAQAVVNGKGGEREAKLLADNAKLQGCVDRVGAANDLLLTEKTALRNEVARLNGQTNWVCKCGGTDCAGQKENAALREAAQLALDTIIDGHKNGFRSNSGSYALPRLQAALGKEAQP